MALGAYSGGIVDRVAICTGGAAMVGTISITAPWMVEGGIPVAGGVTLDAVGAKFARVHRWFRVAGDAVGRELGVNLAGVTLCAGQASVFSSQRKARAGMVETGGFPGAGGMTRTAVRSELAAVSILLCVAGITVSGSALIDIVNMATCTGHIYMRTGQFEGEQIVIHDRQGGGGPAMVGVTGSAGQEGIGQTQGAMQAGWVLPLGCYIGMTGYAATRHAGCAPEGDVTQVTLSTSGRVGRHATQWRTGLCIQFAWAEQDALINEKQSGHDQQGQDGANKTGGSETPKRWTFFHSSTSSGWHSTRPHRCG